MKRKKYNNNNNSHTVVSVLRERLTEQIGFLENYLNILNTQEAALSEGDSSSISQCIEQNQGITEKLADIQKVIIPLHQLYVELCPEQNVYIEELQVRLGSLQNMAVVHGRYILERMEFELETLEDNIWHMPRFENEVFAERQKAYYLDITA